MGEGTVVVMVVCWWFCECVNEVYKEQWLSHREVKSRGAECPLDSKKIAKNGKKAGKRGKIGKKRQKLGRFFHFALLTDRAGYAIDKEVTGCGDGCVGLGWGWGVFGGHREWVTEFWTSGIVYMLILTRTMNTVQWA